MWFLQSGLTFEEILMRLLASVVIIFIVLPLHEYAHGWVAYKLGDNTAKYEGRLTLNPIEHIDPLGALGILLFGFGWAKPVPIDSRNFKNPKSGMALTALAGPVSNLLAAVLGAILYHLIFLLKAYLSNDILFGVMFFFQYYIIINIGLAIFNLIPIPPLDGSKILAAFLPDRIIYKFTRHQNIISFILFCLIILGALSMPLAFLQGQIYKGIMWLVGLMF